VTEARPPRLDSVAVSRGPRTAGMSDEAMAAEVGVSVDDIRAAGQQAVVIGPRPTCRPF